MRLAAEAFQPIVDELHRQSLGINGYRIKTGIGRSQAFGLVGKRSQAPDYSRQCWKRPYLFKLLLEFGEKYVDIPYNAITVNENYVCAPHYDKNNIGESLVVAFGDYTGGELVIHEGNLKGSHNVCHRPLVTDFSKVLHSVKPFTGERFSLVYYLYDDARWEIDVPNPSVRQEGDEWVFYRGDERIDKKEGLPHPLKGYKRH
jgi:hypothetical protein